MDQNFHLLCSPVAQSDRKDSSSYPIYTYVRKTEGVEEFSQMNFDPPNEDNHNDNYSIFNILYSPPPRIPDYFKPIPKDLMLPFPVLTHTSQTESPQSVIKATRNQSATLCQMFDISKIPNQKEGIMSEEDFSRAEDWENVVLSHSSQTNVIVKEYMFNLMKNNEKEIQTFQEFESNIKSKGLKLLSIIVFDIVTDKVTTSYKEVADLILKDTISNFNVQTEKKLELSREEQNIKRRVYDVLNVLISANTFLKEGKIVKKNDIDQMIISKNKRAELNSIYSKLVG